jgi:hypothetical protein
MQFGTGVDHPWYRTRGGLGGAGLGGCGGLGGIELGGGLNTTTCVPAFGSVGSTKQSVGANASRDTLSAGGLASATAPLTASQEMSAGSVLAAMVKYRVTQPEVNPEPCGTHGPTVGT